MGKRQEIIHLLGDKMAEKPKRQNADAIYSL
jgi:hypothetical protein